ncbi:MAG: hypothetical protein ABWY56_06535 [Propionibacteriaceae bacterium]
MATTTSPRADVSAQPTRRLSTETTSSFKTTELIVYVLSVVGVLIASAVIDSSTDSEGFGAYQAWFLVTLLTIGYLVSRGLAKSGSRDHYDA